MGSISIPTALMIGGGLSAGGGILSGIMGSNASGAASKAQQAAVQQALGLEQANLQQTTQNLQPYMTAGTNALSKIQGLLGIGTQSGQPDYSAFTSSPGYQFLLNQGDQGINAKAMGQGMTGNAVKALGQYNQGLAGTTFQTFLGNLLGLSNSGQSAATNLGQIGAGITGNMGAQTIGAGNSAAAGIMGSSNALSGGINSALSALGGTVGGVAGNSQIAQILAALGGGANKSAFGTATALN